MPSNPLRRRPTTPQLAERARAELQRALAIVDEAAATGNLARLGLALAGDALSEVQARFHAYQMAGIQVSPFREGLQAEVLEESTQERIWLRVRYRDRTGFLVSGVAPATAADPVELRVGLDATQTPWRITTLIAG